MTIRDTDIIRRSMEGDRAGLPSPAGEPGYVDESDKSVIVKK